MNTREKDFWGKLAEFAGSLETFAEYKLAYTEALDPFEQPHEFRPRLVNRCNQQSHEPGRAIFTLVNDDNDSNDAAYIKGGEKKNMPLMYTDGSFRIFNAKTGLLQYRFKKNGRTIPVYGYSEAECYQKRLEKESEKPVAEPKLEVEKLTYKKYAAIWFKLFVLPNYTKLDYINSIEGYLKNYINPAIGNYLMQDITTFMLQKLLTSIASDSTRTQVAAVLSASFRDSKIVPNPYLGVRFKRYVQPQLGALTHKEQIKLLEYVKKNFEQKFYDFTRVLLMTGLRQGELLAVTTENIDLTAGRINIAHTWSRRQEFEEPKTRAGKRVIPIAEPLIKILKEYVANKKAGERVFDYTSTNTTGKRYTKIFKKLKIAAFGHFTRHTWLTNAYELGFPDWIVKRWAGHEKIAHADSYLALRDPKEFISTEITEYMLALKEKTVLKL